MTHSISAANTTSIYFSLSSCSQQGKTYRNQNALIAVLKIHYFRSLFVKSKKSYDSVEAIGQNFLDNNLEASVLVSREKNKVIHLSYTLNLHRVVFFSLLTDARGSSSLKSVTHILQ